MNRVTRTFFIASALALPLAGCGSMPSMPNLSSPDPTEWFNVDFLNNKKPLPGERKALFPEGVPGVTQGVPADLVKGNQPPPDAGLALQNPAGPPGAQQAAVEEAAPPPKPKAKAKPKPKSRVAVQPAPIEAEPERAPAAVTVRRPPPAAPAAQQQSGPWPEPPPAQGSAPGGVRWPDPPSR